MGVQALDIGEHQQFLGLQRLGQRTRGGVGIDVVNDPVDVGSQRRHHRNPVGGNQIQHHSRIHLGDVAHQADVGIDTVDADAAPHRGEKVGVLAGDAHRVRAVDVDQVHQFAAHLTEQHHPHHIEHFGCGDPESAFEVAGDPQAFEHGTDLRATAVHHDRVDTAVAQKGHVCGELSTQSVTGHRVTAVFDHHDFAVQLGQPRQGLSQDLRFDFGGHRAHDE